MLRYQRGIPLLILLTLATTVISSGANRKVAPDSDLAAKFEPEITSCLESGKIREAIAAVSRYEEAVHTSYPPPTYEHGLLQSEADHMSFTCPFDNWTQGTLKDLGGTEAPSSSRIEFPLILLNKTNIDSLIVTSIDLAGTRLALGNIPSDGSEKDLNQCAELMGTLLGVKEDRSIENIGEYKVLGAELTTPAGEPGQMFVLANAGKVYVFTTLCEMSESGEVKAKLRSLVKSLTFQFKPTDTAKITAIRAKVTDPNSVKQHLQCVRDLTAIGEYGDACTELIKLRLMVAARIPKPVVSGNAIRYDSYGVVLTNPDPSVWQSLVQPSGGMYMMMLANKSSVDVNGIFVAVVDPLVTYGERAKKMVGPDVTEEENRQYISSSGRAGLLRYGKTIESERFRTFKGMTAYEGIIPTNIRNVKAKILVAVHPRYVLLVMYFVDPRAAVHQFDAYEKALTKALDLKQ